MTLYLSLLVSLVGLVIYCITANPKAATLSLNMFWVGLLAFLLEVGSGRVITFPH